MVFLQTLFKHLLILSGLTMVAVSLYKDKLPEPDFYDSSSLSVLKQKKSERKPSQAQTGRQDYAISPKYDYELQGVVASVNKAAGLTDIGSLEKRQGFFNERDLCVIWGENVKSGVYQRMKFHNDSWTCWSNDTIGEQFKKDELSNNRLLVDNEELRKNLRSVEPGDQIRLKGTFAECENKANDLQRGIGISREGVNNGTCETVYLTQFEIIKKANFGFRRVFKVAKWLTLVSLSGFLFSFLVIALWKKKLIDPAL